jgi:hypothetical protein
MSDDDKRTVPVQLTADVKAPIKTAVAITVAVVVIVLTLFISIGGSYLISLNNRSTVLANEKKFEASQKALKIRELESGVRTSIPTCRALITLDDAKNGASNASMDPHSYGHNLARAITNVVNVSGCRLLIKEVDSGMPLLKIAQQQQRAEDGQSK